MQHAVTPDDHFGIVEPALAVVARHFSSSGTRVARWCNHGYIQVVQWVLLSHRMPREPSTPRIAVWRKLKSLGVAQLGDGLVALPADARTREQLEWVAEDIEQAGGSAMLWTAQPESATHERRVAAEMAGARAEEYRRLCEQAAAEDSMSGLRRLRAALRRVERRDFFPPLERETARAAVQAVSERIREHA